MDQYFFYKSPLGVLKIQLKENKIYSILKTGKPKADSARLSPFSFSKNQTTKHSVKMSELVASFLDHYFSGKRIKDRKPLLFPRGTVFQQKVWKYLQKIPYGQTNTYAEVAKAVGSPEAARAVGSACAKNPYLILVPCHRVVSGNSLGGFALGLKAKKLLLDHELSRTAILPAKAGIQRGPVLSGSPFVRG